MDILKKAARFLGPALLVFIFIRYVDIPLLIKTFKNASALYIFLSYLLTIALYIARILRIYMPLKKSGVSVQFGYFAKIFISSRFLGWLSNAFVSDFVNAVIVMSGKENKMRISNIFIYNRVADVLSALVLFGICFYFNAYLLYAYIYVSYKKVVVILCILFAVSFIFLLTKSKFKAYIDDFLSVGKTFFSDTIILTLIIVMCSISSTILDAKALHIDVSTSFLLLTYTVGIAISVLPISISGIGTREITYIFLMNLVNIPSEKAIALSFLAFIFIPLASLATLYIITLIGVNNENSHNR